MGAVSTLPMPLRAGDAVVDDAHGEHGEIEGGDGGDDGDVLVRLEELDVALVVGNLAPALDVRPRHDPRRPQQHRDHPGAGDQRAGGARGPADAVRQRSRHEDVGH